MGKYAVEAVKMMSEIILAAENSGFYEFDYDIEPADDTSTMTRHAVVYGADKMIKFVGAKVILSFFSYGKINKNTFKIKTKSAHCFDLRFEKNSKKNDFKLGRFSVL